MTVTRDYVVSLLADGMNAYQAKAVSSAIYPEKFKVMYPALGLCGEAGEVAEKIKKAIRDDGYITEDRRKEII